MKTLLGLACVFITGLMVSFCLAKSQPAPGSLSSDSGEISGEVSGGASGGGQADDEKFHANGNLPVRFEAVDLYVDTGGVSLAAYQLEFAAAAPGAARIVGIEGGDGEAFSKPPYYDAKAMQHDRVILAAFNTGKQAQLPAGKTRLATIHVQITGHAEFIVKTVVLADPEGKPIDATIITGNRS